MQSTLYIVGTGPGDPDLLTLKAYHILQRCPVIVAPKAAQGGCSTALSIVKQVVDMAHKGIHEMYFPMKKVRLGETPDPEIEQAWQQTALKVLELLQQGHDIAFPTLGDPAIYSTGYYLYDTLISIAPDINVEFISGISAMSSCSASTLTPVCLGDDTLAVVPATFCEEKIRKALADYDAIVLMKVHKVMDRICRILRETGLTENAIYVERAGMKNQRIIRDLTIAPDNPHYFSTIIVRKRGNGPAAMHRADKVYQASSQASPGYSL